MYTLDMRCHQCMNGETLPNSIIKEIERIEREQNA